MANVEKTSNFQKSNSKAIPDDFLNDWHVELDFTLGKLSTSGLVEKHLKGNDKGVVLGFINNWNEFGKYIKDTWREKCQVPFQKSSQMTTSKLGETYHAATGGKSNLSVPCGSPSASPAGYMQSLPTPTSPGAQLPGDVFAQLGYTQESITELLQTLQTRLDEKDLQIRQLEADNHKLALHVGDVMHNKLGRDESDLEAISIKNRPVKIAEEYGEFTSTLWLDAKQSVDDKVSEQLHFNKSMVFTEEMKCNLLTDILLISYDQITVVLNQQMKTMIDRLNNPGSMYDAHATPANHQWKQSDWKPNFTPDLDNAVSKYLRIQSDTVEFHGEAQLVLDSACNAVKHQYLAKALLKSHRLLKYCKFACKLSWKMLLQRPPMKFDIQGKGIGFNDAYQELHHGSEDGKKKGMVVMYYVTPTLYHGNDKKQKLMCKGHVMVGKNLK